MKQHIIPIRKQASSMRLWHEKLIPELPRQQLLEQHRECCTLRGRGWGKRYATVDYVFEYSPVKLFQYHMLVVDEMKQRGYQVNSLWEDPTYRGENCPRYNEDVWPKEIYTPYPEHDTIYLKKCLKNMAKNGVKLSFDK